jgi:hypothetical protein
VSKEGSSHTQKEQSNVPHWNCAHLNHNQNLEAQVLPLEAARCYLTRTEQRSGGSLKDRAELQTILNFTYSSEILVVMRIDWLARSIHDLKGRLLYACNGHNALQHLPQSRPCLDDKTLSMADT